MTEAFYYDENAEQSFAAQQASAKELALAGEPYNIKMEETRRLAEAMEPFFAAIDSQDDRAASEAQVYTMLSHLIKTDNAHLIAINIEMFLPRLDQRKFATFLIGRGNSLIVQHQIDKFDDPDRIGDLIPGYHSF
jgi:hypothetical protein